LANTIWGILYLGQGTGWSGWARRAQVGEAGPNFLKKNRGAKKGHENGQIRVEK
jgi:hypothetical protein